jgi:hypothetical protein
MTTSRVARRQRGVPPAPPARTVRLASLRVTAIEPVTKRRLAMWSGDGLLPEAVA